MKTNVDETTITTVWEAMAEHFLDTETRHRIPSTAWACVEAELSIEEAQAVWRYEVTPVLYTNVWYTIGGEWSGWDSEWLVRRIARQRARTHRWPLWIGRWIYRVQAAGRVAFENAILETMRHLRSRPDPQRESVRMAALASHFFDFGAAPLWVTSTADLARYRALVDHVCPAIFTPLCETSEKHPGMRRMTEAIQMATSPPGR